MATLTTEWRQLAPYDVPDPLRGSALNVWSRRIEVGQLQFAAQERGKDDFAFVFAAPHIGGPQWTGRFVSVADLKSGGETPFIGAEITLAELIQRSAPALPAPAPESAAPPPTIWEQAPAAPANLDAATIAALRELDAAGGAPNPSSTVTSPAPAPDAEPLPTLPGFTTEGAVRPPQRSQYRKTEAIDFRGRTMVAGWDGEGEGEGDDK